MHDKEYLVHVGGKSYAEALAYCKTKGGKLVEPKSAQANNDIIDLAKAIGIQANIIWIGINDISQEGDFRYASDGKPLTYTNWNPGQPDDSGNNEDCVLLWNKYEFKWNDAPCSLKRSFICGGGIKSTILHPSLKSNINIVKNFLYKIHTDGN